MTQVTKFALLTKYLLSRLARSRCCLWMRDLVLTGPVYLLVISVHTSRNLTKAFQVSGSNAKCRQQKLTTFLVVRDERLELPTFSV